MALAAVAMSPVEAAQAVFDSATKGAAEANGKVEFYAGQRRELEKQVAALTAKYNAACKSFAAGDGVDPQPARDELGRAESRLVGTIMLHEEWERTAQPLSMKLRQAGRQLALKRPATQTLIGSGVTEGWRPQARKPGMAVDPAYSTTAFRLLPRSLTSISLPAFRER